MNRFTLAAIASILSAAAAQAGGLDRSGQRIDILFEEGNYAELTFGYVAPDASGSDGPLAGPFAGQGTGDVTENYFQGGIAIKTELGDALSFAFIVDQPYGANVDYPVFDPTGGDGSLLLGGTSATLDSTALTALFRYKFNERVSVHGGVRAQHLNAAVTLQGAAYSGAFGPGGSYATTFDGDTALGYQVGVAYEIPEIALRVAATYFSEIDHDLDTSQTVFFGTGNPAAPIVRQDLPGSNTEVTTPRAVNLSFQTGVAEGTLLFGSFRYADYGVVLVRPSALMGTSLTDIDTARDYTLGVGRKFTEQFSASIAANYSDSGPDDVVSPLAPTDGSYGVTLAGSYQITDAVRLSGGINYSRLGDAVAAPGGNPVTPFDDNDAIGVGLRLGYSF